MRRALIPAVLLAAACGGKNEEPPYACRTCVRSPEAVSEDDGAPTGVYKGVFAGSDVSGTLKATIDSDEADGACEVTVDGTTTPLTGLSTGQDATLLLRSFTGEGQGRLDLVLSSVGAVVSADLTWGDAPALTVAGKEHSTRLVRVFEGSWLRSDTVGADDGQGEPQGLFSLVVTDAASAGAAADVAGLYRGTAGTVLPHVFGTFSGTARNGTLDVVCTGCPDIEGRIEGDTAEGTWASHGYEAQWSAERTL